MEKKQEEIKEPEKLGFFGTIKKYAKIVKTGINKAGTITKKIINNEKIADGIMRWPRIVAFFLMTIMFVVGWFNTAGLLAFAQAISALPADFWTAVYIILGSIGASKLGNDIVKVISSRK